MFKILFEILFAIFGFGPTTPGIEAITKLDVAHQAPQYLQPLFGLYPLAWQPLPTLAAA
jgi:hypothetical protein